MQKETRSISRTRTGCKTCRSRKIKCDEQRPKCQRCIKGSLDCSYGLHLIWYEESLSKGIAHGRTGVWSKAGRRNRERLEQQQSSQGLPSVKIGNASSVKNDSDGSLRTNGNHHTPFLNTTMQDVRLYFEYGGIAKEDEGNEEANRVSKDSSYSSDQQLLAPQESHQRAEFSLSLPVLSNTTLSNLRTLDYDSALLSYYEAVVCSSRTLLDDTKNNPYRHLILPMAMQSEGLYHATLAVSAQILRIAEPRYQFAALDHGHRALKCLITSLQRGNAACASGETNWSRTEIDEILGLALMLCWFEITDGCRPSWVTHLKGIHTLISQHQDVFVKNSKTSDVNRFFNRYFSFHLVLARTVFRVEDDITFPPVSSDTHTTTTGGSNEQRSRIAKNRNGHGPISKLTDFLSLAMPLEDLDEIDAYMGFSNSLLLLINEVTDLAWKYSTKDSLEIDLPHVRTQVQRLRHSLETLHQTPPPLADSNKTYGIEKNTYSSAKENSQEDDLVRTVTEFQAIAEANRLGALLLLHEVCASRFQKPDLFGKPRASAAPSSEHDDDHDLSTSASYKTYYVRGILDPMIQNINQISRTAALPLWPLFIAGCCVTTEADQMTVIRIFEETEKLKRYGNITPARQVIEMIWRQRDLSVQDDRKRRHAAAIASFCTEGKISSPSIELNSSKAHSRGISALSPTKGMQLFEWERAMSMMGGLKLSLT